MSGDGFTYRAFISYSHADSSWGKWLHRELERFRAPKQLAAGGARRLGRCFRDEAEMGAAAHLPEKIGKALGGSEWLVVICSPRSAASQWVNKEIAEFKALGREQRVLALIVDGQPGGSCAEDAAVRARECFPDALRVTADGGVAEPLAVDVRKFGRADAIVRIVSEIIGVDYDALRQREARRRRWALIRAQALFVTGLVLTAGALAGGYLAAQNYAASSAARSDLFAREANALFAENQHARAMLMALEGDPAARAGVVEQWFNPEGYEAARQALSRSVTYNRLAGVNMRPGGLVSRVAFLPDGERFLSVEGDGVARLWKRGESKPLAEFRNDSEEMNLLSVFPDGKSFLTNGIDGEVWLWRTDDPSSGKVIAVVEGLTSLAAHPDGEHFLAGMFYSSPTLWKIGATEPEAEYPGSETGTYALAIHPAGQVFVTGALDGTLQVWRFGETAPAATYRAEGAPMVAIAFHPTTNAFITGSTDGVVRMWMPDMATPATTRTAGPGDITDVAFHPDGRRFMASRLSGEVVVWDSEELAQPLVLAGAEGEPRTLSLSPDGKVLLTSAMDGGVRLWDMTTDAMPPGPVDAVRVRAALPDPTGRRTLIALLGGGGELREATGVVAPALPAEVGRLWGGAFAPGGELFVTWAETAIDTGEARLWRVGANDAVQTFSVPDAAMSSAAIDAGGRQVLTGHDDGTVRVWTVGQAAPVKTVKIADVPVNAVAWRSDGVHFMAGSSRGDIALWRTDGSAPLMTMSVGGELDGIVISPDDARFVTTHGGYAPPQMWMADGGGVAVKLGAQADQNASVAFLRDGRHVAAMSKAGIGTVWVLGDGAPVATFGRYGDGEGAIAALADDTGVVTGLRDGTLKTWRVPPVLRAAAGDQVRMACETLRASGFTDFTEADWARFPILDRTAPHPCAAVWGHDPRKGGTAPGLRQ